jgi:hypothetical protein
VVAQRSENQALPALLRHTRARHSAVASGTSRAPHCPTSRM